MEKMIKFDYIVDNIEYRTIPHQVNPSVLPIKI